MNPNAHRGDPEEPALVRYLVIYVLTAWATLVIPLLLGHGVLVAVLCATPVGLAGIWFVAWTVRKDDDRGHPGPDRSVAAYDCHQSD